MTETTQAHDTGVLADGTLVELVGEAKSGWQTVRLEDGTERKVRPKAISEIPFTTEDDLEPERKGDVFPAGIRETYERGKTESGAVFIDNGDPIAVQMRGFELLDVAKVLAELDDSKDAQGWVNVYTADRVAAGKAPLNAGMVRMNLGNKIRGALKRKAKADAEAAPQQEAARDSE